MLKKDVQITKEDIKKIACDTVAYALNSDKGENMTSNLRKIVFFILLLGIAFCAYQYMIKPANRNLAEKRHGRNRRWRNWRSSKRRSAATKDLNKQLEQLQKAIQFFEGKLPPKSEIHKVLEQVTLIAQKQGLEPKTIRALTEKGQQRLYRAAFENGSNRGF